MTQKLMLSTAIVATLFLSSAAIAYTITGHAHALIRTAVTSSEAQQMNFGAIDSNATGGTVTLTTSGTASSTGGLVLSANKSQGKITIVADPNTTLTISIANGSLTGPGTAMAVNNFTTDPAIPTVPTGTTGSITLNVGADLVVGANQKEGAYAGTYDVTINY